MTSCSIWTKFKAVPSGESLNPPDTAMMLCPELEKPERGGDIRVLAAIWAGQYVVCQKMHENLVQYIEKKQAERGKK